MRLKPYADTAETLKHFPKNLYLNNFVLELSVIVISICEPYLKINLIKFGLLDERFGFAMEQSNNRQ